ncbi:MAG: hypothetical protein KAI75_04700, partial [Desulfobulbaceae bacterium]|nr:hypothetical protein [Desulfobulbaceae bacterium]
MRSDHFLSKHIPPASVFLQSVLLVVVLLCATATAAKTNHYDIAYIWDDDIESVLDYKEELESLLGPKVSKRLKVVTRDREYGIIYDQNGSDR